MASVPSTTNHWLSLIEEGGFFDEFPSNTPFLWNGEQQTLESSNDNLNVDEDAPASETSPKSICGSKKRKDASIKDDTCTKAVRERMRREKLNVRFLELSEATDPEKTPKTDKSLILSDAVRVIEQLRSETSFLKEENLQLQEQLSYLKTEKNELKEEKMRLTSENEMLKYQAKSLSNPFPSFPFPTFVSPYQAQAPQMQVQGHNPMPANFVKPTPIMASSLLPQPWSWLPPSVLDTSNDHVLHPPTA